LEKLYTTGGKTLLLLLLKTAGRALIDCCDDITLVEELHALRLLSLRSATTTDADLLEWSGTTKLLDEELPSTAAAYSSLFSLPKRFSKSEIRF
jgi:hypothetical protein